MQEVKTQDSETMIERNPYDISSDEDRDEDEDNTLPVPTLLKQLKLLTLVRTCEARASF